MPVERDSAAAGAPAGNGPPTVRTASSARPSRALALALAVVGILILAAATVVIVTVRQQRQAGAGPHSTVVAAGLGDWLAHGEDQVTELVVGLGAGPGRGGLGHLEHPDRPGLL